MISLHNSTFFVSNRSLMHHDNQKIIFFDNFYQMFPICDRKDFQIFSLIKEVSLLSTPLPLSTSIITLGKKNDDEKTLFLKIIWLYKVGLTIKAPSIKKGCLIFIGMTQTLL